jgi:RNA polymerase sigma factor (sigma-70 family)
VAKKCRTKTDYADLERRLFIRLRQLGAMPDCAEDLVQQALLRLLEYDRPIRNARALAFSIVDNLLIDEVRKHRVRKDWRMSLKVRYGCLRDERDGFRYVAAYEVLGRLRSTLEHMPERRRKAWVSARISGDRVRVIASRAGVTTKSVEKALALADRDIEAAFPKAHSLAPAQPRH